MYVNGCHGLAAVTVAGFSQGVLHEKRAGAQRAILRSTVNVQLVLPFQRNEYPGARRMKIQMADLIIEAAAGRNGLLIRQQSIFVADNFQRARVFGFTGSRPVTPSPQNHGLIRWIHTNLVPVDPKVEWRSLF